MKRTRTFKIKIAPEFIITLLGVILAAILFLFLAPEPVSSAPGSDCTCKALERSARALERIERKLKK